MPARCAPSTQIYLAHPVLSCRQSSLCPAFAPTQPDPICCRCSHTVLTHATRCSQSSGLLKRLSKTNPARHHHRVRMLSAAAMVKDVEILPLHLQCLTLPGHSPGSPRTDQGRRIVANLCQMTQNCTKFWL